MKNTKPPDRGSGARPTPKRGAREVLYELLAVNHLSISLFFSNYSIILKIENDVKTIKKRGSLDNFFINTNSTVNMFSFNAYPSATKYGIHSY